MSEKEHQPVDQQEGDVNQAPNGNEEVQQDNGNQGMPENLHTEVVSFEGRSYYLDVRENRRGRYLKLTEKSMRKRSTVLLAGHVVGIFGQILNDAIEDNLPLKDLDQIDDQWKTVFSRRVNSFRKKIYFDIMKNSKGKSLNIAEVSLNRGKSAVIISEGGWNTFSRALNNILEQFPDFKAPAIETSRSKPIKSRKIALKNKTLFFDLIENEGELFLKLSELRGRRRETLYIPSVCFPPLTDLFDNLLNDEFGKPIDSVEDRELPERREGEDEKRATVLGKKALKVQADNPADMKTFNMELRENEYGRFLWMNELVGGKRSAVLLPDSAYQEIKDVLVDFGTVSVSAE